MSAALSDASLPAKVESGNPWAEVESQQIPLPIKPVEAVKPEEEQVAPPSTSVFNDAAILPPSPNKVVVDTTVLDQFDPLVDKVESNAREAWTTAESHPPPPVNTPKPLRFSAVTTHNRRPSTALEPPTSAAAHVTTFATLANLARAPFKGRPSTPTSAQSSPAIPPKILPPTVEESPAPDPPTKEPPDAPSKEVLFDFQKFLDQMKTKSAEPVAKYLRSFLTNFSKKTFTVNDQIKLIQDFLSFITLRMRDCSVWKHASPQEFDHAAEAMEKLVMNRLYDYTFTPQIDQVTHTITTDDLERDHVLRQRMKLFGWVEEKHLDIPTGEGSQGFLNFAQQELLKINHYKAPRDKLICILNACKVIFGLIRHLQKEEGADSFIPILIFVVLQANPEHLISNVEYINRFRSPNKLQSEAGYYLSSLMGAVSFIETMDHTALSNITQEEFESNVERAILALPPSPSPTVRNDSSSRPTPPLNLANSPTPTSLLPSASHTGEESARPLQMPSTTTIAEDTKRFLQRTGDIASETISKPLNAIGKIFNGALDGLEEMEREREREREQERELAKAYGDGTRSESPAVNNGVAAVFNTEWLFGGGSRSTTPSIAATGPDGRSPRTPAGAIGGLTSSQSAIQTPYKPRVRTTSTGSSRAGTPTHGGQSTSPYQIPPLTFSPSIQPLAISNPNSPAHRPQGLPTSQSLPHDQLRHPQPSPLNNRLHPQAHLYSDPNTRHASPLDLTALQNEIDRAHSAVQEASKGTLLQIFPHCEEDIIDMVLEANNGDLGLSIDQLLEITGT